MVGTRWIVFLAIAAAALAVVLASANLYWGDLNQDEGWYLYAARQVHEGRLPYRDFAFTQGPMLPLVYSLVDSWVDRWGVGGGRFFTALLGFASALAAGWLAGRTGPKKASAAAALLAFLLIGVNVYQSYFTTVVKTYSLCTLFLTLGFVALTYAGSSGGIGASFLSGLFLALAAGTRVSAGAALPVAGLYLLFNRRPLGDSRWLAFGVGGVLGLAAVSVPFLLVASDGYWFALFNYHSGRSAGSLASLLVYKAGFLSRLVQAYFVPAALGAALVLLRWFKPVAAAAPAETSAPRGFGAALWITALAITVVHLAAPFPYEDYQVLVYPVAAAALAAALVRYVVEAEPSAEGPSRWMLWLVCAVFLASAAAAFSSPVNQGWVSHGRDRIWWRVKEQSSLQLLKDIGLWLREEAALNGTLLTQDTYLAVEAGLRVPAGLEMGPFSYFPDMPRARAEKLHVVNREMLREILETSEADWAAFSGYGLSIASPAVQEIPEDEQEELWQIVHRRYDLICVIPDFGQGSTMLRVMRRLPAGEPGEP